MGKLKKELENAKNWVYDHCDEIEAVMWATTIAGSAFIVGHEVGFKKGLKNGYSIGMVAGQNSILSKMAMVVRKGA
jgi:hypothetical protein